VSDDLRSQLQAMARWADAQHEPIDPGVTLGQLPSDVEVDEWPDGWPVDQPSSTSPADRRRWLVLAAAVVAIVVGTSVAVVTRQDGVTVDIPPAATSPNGWSAGAGFPSGTSGTGPLNGNLHLAWTGTEVLVPNADPIGDPMPPVVQVGDDGPIGTVPGQVDAVHGRFGRSLAYDPLRRTWRTLPDPGLDITDDGVPWVWTGTEYIVAGRPELAGCVAHAGDTPPTTLACMPGGASAAAVDPATGAWRRLADPPEHEIQQSDGLWTGDTAVFVGGAITTYVPATDSWRVVVGGDPTAPIERQRPTFNSWAWDGRELILVFSFLHAPGELESRAWGLDLASGALRPLPGPPIAVEHLVGTGNGVIGWAADGSVGSWDPVTATWTLGAAAPLAPREVAARNGTIAWTGDHLVVWGGGAPDEGPGLPAPNDDLFTDGAIYDPTTDSWAPIPPIDLPGLDTRAPRAAVWVGVGLVVIQPGRDGYDVLTWSPL